MSVATMPRDASAAPQTGRAARLAARRGSSKARPQASRRAMCRATSPSCRVRWRAISCASASSIPKPCPLLAASAPGDCPAADARRRPRHPHRPAALPRVPATASWSTSRTDIRAHWRDDLVAFVLGCSFSFEEALLEDGIELRHITCDATVPMYRTSIATAPAGPFHGPMVVSMRPIKPADAIRAIQITTRFPAVHGAPVHIGKPELIGIADLGRPDYGDAVPIDDDEIPVFWACGVTPQSVVATVEAGILHHPLSRLHAGHRSPQHRICNHVKGRLTRSLTPSARRRAAPPSLRDPAWRRDSAQARADRGREHM